MKLNRPDNHEVYSAIDVGSNAIRIALADWDQREWKLLKKFRDPVRLGKDVFSQQTLKKETIDLAVKSFSNFAKLNKKYSVKKCRAVATSAMREAKNAAELIQAVATETGILIEIIDGKEEAKLIHRAVCLQINVIDTALLFVDIGGGSVELTHCHGDNIINTQSFPLGTVRLMEELKKRQLQEKDLLILLGGFIRPLSDFLHQITINEKISIAVGTGGNLEAMAKLKLDLLKKSSVQFLLYDELLDMTKRLADFSFEERIKTLRLRPDRADVIYPAMLVLKTILRQAEIQKILIPCVGLREGVLMSMVDRRN